MTPDDRFLLNDIDRYLAATGMTDAAFGKAALNDNRFLPQLRAGERSPTSRTVAKVRAFMAQHPAAKKSA